MGSDNLFFGFGSRLDLDDIRPGSKPRQSLISAPRPARKDAGQHDKLEPHSADCPANMEKTVPKFNFGRFTNEKASVETSGHNTRLPRQQFGEPRLVPPSPLSVCLTARPSLAVQLATGGVAQLTAGRISHTRTDE
jgi:hypothetical protein